MSAKEFKENYENKCMCMYYNTLFAVVVSLGELS